MKRQAAGLEFPIPKLLDDENSAAWLLKHFHPKGLKCLKCQKGIDQSRNQTSDNYNLSLGTVCQGTPRQVVLLMRGIYHLGTGSRTAIELKNGADHAPSATSQRRIRTTNILKQMKCCGTRGKKVTCFLIQMIRPENEPANNVDTERMIMIVHPALEQWDGKADKCAYVWFTIQTEKHWKHRFIGLH